MSKYITMVDVDEDYLQHGKFIAKVKGLGGKVRYFYNTNEYMAFLKGGKKGYESQKKTNQMNKAMDKRTGGPGNNIASDMTRKQWAQNNAQNEARGRYMRGEEPKGVEKLRNMKARSKVIADAEAVKDEVSKRKMNEGKANDAAAKSKQLDERVKQTRQKVITKQMNAGRDELDKPRVTTYSDDDYNIVGNTISGREVDERYKQYTRDNQKKRQELDTALRKSGKTMSDDARNAFEQELSKSRQDKLNKYANDAINTPEGLAAYQKNVEAIEEARKSAFEQRYNETGERIDAEREKMKKKKYVK